ncbi:MAG: type II toxin-antitoxin system PemK/MazF family toxin [Terracidiphilus sp.]|jgi:mRNA interferase MazF
MTRGEVWQVDLGLAAKVRPALVLSQPPADSDRALVTLVPHTTAIRGSAYEVTVRVGFLRDGAFDAQNLVTIPRAKLMRRLGGLTDQQLSIVESAVRRWLGLDR